MIQVFTCNYFEIFDQFSFLNSEPKPDQGCIGEDPVGNKSVGVYCFELLIKAEIFIVFQLHDYVMPWVILIILLEYKEYMWPRT